MPLCFCLKRLELGGEDGTDGTGFRNEGIERKKDSGGFEAKVVR